MLYSRIAQALQEISSATRGGKVDLAAGLLSEIESEPEMLCPVVRLLLGELWPPWEGRVMGIGPEALMAALAEVSDRDLPFLRERCSDPGMVAEAALAQKGQHSLFREPLQALSVYERLMRISSMRGEESEQRKNALLRGLFLEATPLEGKYIARTALRNMQAGMGHVTMIAALSRSLNVDLQKIRRAFSLMPDLGRIAIMAKGRMLDSVAIRPTVPIRNMLFRRSEAEVPGAFLPKYPGLRVQVHKVKKEVFVFTSQLRNITLALNGICRLIGEMDGDYVVDADLIGYHDNRCEICSQAEMHRYINRRRLSRKSRILPALLAYDIISLDGEDICRMPYQDRRKRLLSILGTPKGMPFSGISSAEERVLMDSVEAMDYLCQVEKAQALALLGRDLQAAYCPGEVAAHDFIVRAEHHLAAFIVRVIWDRGEKKNPPARYEVALRSGEVLVPVGYAVRGLSERDQPALSQRLKSLVRNEDESGADVTAQVVLDLKIGGAHKRQGKYSILEPVIEGVRLNASWEDADLLETLETICGR